MERVTHLHPTALCHPAPTEAALCAWVGQAHPGDQLVYHSGYLAIDAGPESLLGPARRQELRRLADRAWQLAHEGAVHLVQRRNGDADYTYVLVARPRCRTAGGAMHAVLEQAGLSDLRRSA